MRTPRRSVYADGRVSFKVRYRLEGTETSTSFIGQPEDEADLKDAAITFSKMVAAVGPTEALEWQRRNESDDGAAEEPTSPTLDEWSETYINTRTGVTDGTRHGYRRTYALSYQQHLGHMELHAITRADIALALNWLGSKGGRSGKGYSDKTIANAHGFLASMMKEALADGVISSNPCARIKLPRATSHRSAGMNLMSEAEALSLIKASMPHHRPLVATLFATGIRWGEAEAVEVRDFDPEAMTLRINKAAKWDTSKATRTVGPTKTRMSDRTVTLPEQLVEMLLPISEGRPRTARLFTAPRGGGLKHKTFWESVWLPACEKSGLSDPRPRIHDARHSHASWLIAKNVPLTVIQARLGHNSIKVTSDTYGHLSPDIQRAAAAAADLSLTGLRAINA